MRLTVLAQFIAGKCEFDYCENVGIIRNNKTKVLTKEYGS